MILAEDVVQTAKTIGLQYVNTEAPGFTRRKNGKGFIYLDNRGNKIKDRTDISRLESLAIPPPGRMSGSALMMPVTSKPSAGTTKAASNTSTTSAGAS